MKLLRTYVLLCMLLVHVFLSVHRASASITPFDIPAELEIDGALDAEGIQAARAFGSLGVPPDMYWPSNPTGQCVNLTEVPLLYPGVVIPQVCFSYVLWDKVYVDNNTLIRNVFGRIAMGGSWTSQDCLLSGYRQWCTMMFRPCFEFTPPAGYGSGTVALGQYPCRQYCELSHSTCYGAIVAAIEATAGWTQADLDAALSCEPPWEALYGTELLGTPIFPNSTYMAPLTATNGASYFNVSMSCYRGNENITVQPASTICPTGLFFQDGTCNFNCPEPILTDSEYDAITIMLSVMGWISILSAAFLALTFLMDPEKRKFPTNLSIFFILCIMCLSFTWCLGNMATWRDVWCDDNDRPNTFGGPACTIQGIIFVYFTLASVLWWLVVSFNLLLLVTKVQPPSVKLDWMDYFRGLRFPKGWLRWETLFLGYHIFAWVPPFIPLIIALGAHRLGYGGHDLWCTIHSGDAVKFIVDSTGSITFTGGDPANIWNLILLTVPILSIVFIGIVILITVVIVGLIRMGWRFFLQQWRLFLFILFYIWIYTFVFSFQIHLAVQANSQYQAYTDYINCAYLQQLFQDTSSPLLQPLACSSPDISGKVSFPLWFIVAFNESSQGLLLLLLYGTSIRFFKMWYLLFKNPKALLSSRFGSTSGTTSKVFTVEGRKVTMENPASSNSKHMMDELASESEEGSSSDTATSTSNEDNERGAAQDDEGAEEESSSQGGDEGKGDSDVELDDMDKKKAEKV